jgi:hypothetical protein
MRRQPIVHMLNLSLAQSSDISLVEPLPISDGGFLGLEARITSAAGGAPTDTPVGTWLLYLSNDATNFGPFVHDLVTQQLLRLVPNANNKVQGFASLRGLPAAFAKLQYVYGSGGNAGTRATVLGLPEP